MTNNTASEAFNVLLVIEDELFYFSTSVSYMPTMFMKLSAELVQLQKQTLPVHRQKDVERNTRIF
jgi:hypothetical protein